MSVQRQITVRWAVFGPKLVTAYPLIVLNRVCIHTRLDTSDKRPAFRQNSISEKNEHDISSLDDGLRIGST